MLVLRIAAFWCLLVVSVASAQERRPNILFIMSDDHAAHAIGAYGGRLAALNPTPVRGLKVEVLRLKEKVGDTDEKYPELMQVCAAYWK